MANLSIPINVVSVHAENINHFYDEARCHGDYWQPSGVAIIRLRHKTLVTVEYEDFNLGIFGRREDYTIMADGFQWSWSESCSNEEWNTPKERLDVIFRCIEGILEVNPVELLTEAINAIRVNARYNWDTKHSI